MTRIHLRYEGTIQVSLTHKFGYDVSVYSSELQDYCIKKGYISESLAYQAQNSTKRG
jgi:hypothetical protein